MLEQIENLFLNCGGLKAGEKVLIIVDSSTVDLGNVFYERALALANASLEILPEIKMHGQEPSPDIAEKMHASDLILCLTRKSLAHTKARFEATNSGSRFLSLPDYSFSLLEHKSLLVDFRSLVPESDALAERLSAGEKCRVTTELGTDIEFVLSSRVSNSCPGVASKAGQMSSPPDAEVNIAPLESETNGVIYVDGSIPCDELGLLKEPLKVTVDSGRIVKIEGEKASVLESVFRLSNSEKSKILGELGFGLNPEAKLCGIMLEDEGCRGTVHFGFGSNCTIGGVNKAPMHLDMVIRKPNVYLDGKLIVECGKIHTDIF